LTVPRLLLDEDVRPLLAAALQRSGFDAVHALDLGLSGAPDGEILATAIGERRTREVPSRTAGSSCRPRVRSAICCGGSSGSCPSKPPRTSAIPCFGSRA